MGEIDVGHPGGVIQGKAAGSGGQMDVAVAFQIAAKGVKSQIDAWDKAFFSRPLFNDISGEDGNKIEEVTIHPKKGLQGSRECPGDMLPEGIG